MPGKNGIEATKYITDHFPHIAIIALSMNEDSHLITEILQAGARGYLLKDAEQYEIIEGIKTVHAGHTYYCRHTMRRFNEMKAIKNSEADFSAKEIIIIKLICCSCTSQEIGNQLKLSRRTVEGYRERIMQRLEIDKPIDLLRYAIRHKIYQLESF
jgi:DNA-binding NarL/FixJ family response regulator